MKKMISSFLCLLLLAGLIAGCGEQDGTASNAAAVDTFSVGYARVDISPTASVPMGGFGDGRMSTMVTEPLYTNCIAISDKDTTVLVFTLDLTRSYSQAIPDIRSYISEQTGIPVSNIMTTASHTHSGPDLSMKTTPAIADYITALREQMLEAANAALEDRKPAALEATSIRPENMNYVRHYIMDNGTYAGSNFGSYKSGKIVGHVSKADNLMQLLKFTRDNGNDVVLVNWQGHYRVEKGTLISSDYYGILRSNLEKELDCHAAFVLGPSGNVNTRSQINTEPSILNYVEYGNKLTEYALEAAKNFVPIQTGRVEITENLYQAESVKGGNKVEYPLYALSVGDAAFVFDPTRCLMSTASASATTPNITPPSLPPVPTPICTMFPLKKPMCIKATKPPPHRLPPVTERSLPANTERCWTICTPEPGSPPLRRLQTITHSPLNPLPTMKSTPI